MSMRRFLPQAACLACAAALVALPAQAAIVTIAGPSFDLSYDTALLGPYGTPSVSGNTIFFTTSVTVQRFDSGSSSAFANLAGLTITMHDSLRIDSLSVSILGDYYLDSSSASVGVRGRLEAKDALTPGTSLTGSDLAVDGATPLTTIGTNTDWRAGTRVDAGTAVGSGQTNVFLSGARSIGITLGTELTASLGADIDFGEAFIEQKFSGLRLVVSPAALPVPGTAALLLVGLAAAALLRRRS